MSSWLAFWDSDHSIYVSERHKAAHARQVLSDIRSHIRGEGVRLLDFGCGEARYAEQLVPHCEQLVLCEAAEQVRARLAERVSGLPKCRVIGSAGLQDEAAASFDLIIVNSVLQYIDRAELGALLETWRDLLAEDGRLILADVIRPGTSAVRDAVSLLSFARGQGFFVEAAIGLGRTMFSDYRRIRGELGLQTYQPADLQGVLRQHGLEGVPSDRNFGHNQARFTLLAQRT